jgi:hypothetical protein
VSNPNDDEPSVARTTASGFISGLLHLVNAKPSHSLVTLSEIGLDEQTITLTKELL